MSVLPLPRISFLAGICFVIAGTMLACVGDDPDVTLQNSGVVSDANASPAADSGNGDPVIDASRFSGDAGADADADAGPRCDLTKPFTNIKTVPGVNSAYSDAHGTLSRDELHIYFASNRTTDGGFSDLYTASRSDPHAAFTNIAPMTALNATQFDERGGCLSRSGEAFFFHSSRTGGYDLFVSRRNSPLDPFPAPTDLGPGVNSPYYDLAPCPNADESALYFASQRDGGGPIAIYRAAASGGGFVNPVPLAALSGEAPIPTADELGLYFRKDDDIYLSTRPNKTVEFTTASPVSELNSDQIDSVSWVSEDGCRLLFWSARDGSNDIFEATRP